MSSPERYGFSMHTVSNTCIFQSVYGKRRKVRRRVAIVVLLKLSNGVGEINTHMTNCKAITTSCLLISYILRLKSVIESATIIVQSLRENSFYAV